MTQVNGVAERFDPKEVELVISLVPVQAIPVIWDKVGHMLKRATDLSQGRYRLHDLKAKLLSGEFQLWVVMDGTHKILAAITSTFTVYPQGKSLHGQFLGGDRLEDWKDDFCDIFKRWAYDNHCSMIEFTGRKGWSRVLEPNGYREVFRTYQIDLKH